MNPYVENVDIRGANILNIGKPKRQLFIQLKILRIFEKDERCLAGAQATRLERIFPLFGT